MSRRAPDRRGDPPLFRRRRSPYLDFARVLERFGTILLTLACTNPFRPEPRALAKAAREAFKGARVSPNSAVSHSPPSRRSLLNASHMRDALHAASGSTMPNNQSGSALGFLGCLPCIATPAVGP